MSPPRTGRSERAQAARPPGRNRAGLQDPDPGQGEVEPDGVLGADRPERIGDLLGHLSVDGVAGGKPQPFPQPRHVRVDGDDQLPGAKNRPDPEIHPVAPSNHPTQEQVVPLAGGSLARIGKQEIPLPRDPVPPRFPETGEKAREPCARAAALAFHFLSVETFQRTVLEENFPDAKEEPVYAAGGDKPVGKP